MKTPGESIKDYVNGGNSAISGHTLRSSASQCSAALATNLIKFTFGSFFGITTILVAELHKENAEIEISLGELTWFGSLCFMVPVGSILMGLIAQYLGPRRCLLLTTVMFITSCGIFYCANNSTMLLSGQAIAGLAAPATIGPGTTYIVETAQPHLRSALVASTNLSVIVGAFLTILYSNWLHWRTIILIDLVTPTLGFFAMFMIPESPHWLASKGKLDEAEKALSWLRGWTTADNVSEEFNSLKETYKMPDENSSSRPRDSYRTALKPYVHRTFYRPLATVGCMFVLHSCTGFSAIITYCMVIFRIIDAPIDSHLAASLFDVMRITGAILCILSVHRTGKRKLTFVSLIGAGLLYFTIAGLLFLKTQSSYADYAYTINWSATVLVIFSTFLTSAGVDKAIFMYNAELFPTKFRNVGTGIGLFIHAIGGATISKTYLYLEEAVSLSGTFVIFGIFCFVSCVTFYFLLPETEGKTLQEIEDHYNKTTTKDTSL
ncbi:facilitated trehalose transporter Tret1-like [Phymastichus coffea]|uniref:facilitated trehalose transporter Tret1-like n=1 Tax=Phymastichus coffea TaxID=108790 RepID=UPI00273B2D7A|nr:facilitated trehalose transporter Tret1-like [Phymastichus coffea]